MDKLLSLCCFGWPLRKFEVGHDASKSSSWLFSSRPVPMHANPTIPIRNDSIGLTVHGKPIRLHQDSFFIRWMQPSHALQSVHDSTAHFFRALTAASFHCCQRCFLSASVNCFASFPRISSKELLRLIVPIFFLRYLVLEIVCYL